MSDERPNAEQPESGRLPTGRLAFVTRRPVAITMLMVAIAVFGAVSLGKLPIDLLPEISYPTLTVRTTWRGAAPEDVEDRMSERIQEALSTLPHLVRSSSVSRAETSDVVLDFDWGTPMTFAVQDVRDRLDGVFLPEGAERPLILRYDPNLDPILRIALAAPEAKPSGLTGAKPSGLAGAKPSGLAGAKPGESSGAAPNGASTAKPDAVAETAAEATSSPADRADGPASAGAFPTASSERALIQLRWLAEHRVKRDLETLPGVAAVQVRGGLQEEIRVRVDPFKMAAQGLDPAVLATRLAQENLNASGGSIREGSTEYLVRTLNEFRDLAEIENLAIVRRGEAVIRVRDVATVTRTHAEREVITRLDGREAVEVAIFREAGANIVALADTVRERVFGTEQQQKTAEELEKRQGGVSGASYQEREQADYLAYRMRHDARLEVLSDQSTFIRDAVDDVKSSAWMGVVLTVFLIWLSLRSLVPTLIISLSIPISVVVTFAPMYLMDVSLNIMSLGGLALGVGMVVDASIVVLESIMRCQEEGDPLAVAAVRGTREVAGAITGSTLTSIAVFAPIVFVHGVAGRIFGDQALTVVSSLIVSLAVAVLFIPVLASRPWLSSAAGGAPARALEWLAWPFKPVLKLHDAAWAKVERAYPRLLSAALDRPWVVVGLSALLCVLAAWRVRHIGIDLLPEIHQAEFTGHVGLQVGSPLHSTDEVLGEIDRSVRADVEGVDLTALTVGVEKDTLTREIEGKHTARLTVRLEPDAATPEQEERILAAVRDRIAAHPAVRSVEFTRPTPFAIAAPVQVEVLGWDLEKIERVGADVAERLSRVEGLSDVRTSVRPGHPEVRITFDRDKTLEYGLELDQVSKLVRDQVLGNVSTRFSEGDDRIDVRVIGDEVVLGELERVLDLAINPSAAVSIPLRDVAAVTEVQGPAEIRRIGNTRAVVVNAASAGLDLGDLTARIENALSGLPTPDDVVVQIGGQKREMDEAQSSMRFALLLALFLVYAVMASQFESVIQPLIILVTVPLAFVGVVFALDLLGIPLSVVVFIGMILLAGIVVSNAIVLLDRVNQTRAQGWSVREALLEAGATRLRPIYMTANTTVIGLLPLSGWLASVPWIGKYCSGAGVELRAPMAITVMAGLTCSTVLTLVVIPAVYSIVFRRADERRRLAAQGASG